MPTPIDVAMIADDAYTEPLHAALVSLVDSARTPLRLHVLSTQGDVQAARTRALLGALRIEQRFVDRREIAVHLARRPKLSGHFRGYPHAVKLLADELLPDLARVLYLDSDLIVRHDLGPLWSVDLQGRILAAVEDASFIGARHAAFRAWHAGRYFNSGVMVADLAAWRAADVGGRFADWRRFYERAGGVQPWIAYWEQSPLNMAVAGRWVSVPPCWNWWPAFVARTGHEEHGMSPEAFAAVLGLTADDLHRFEDDPAVCHFAGPNKPWLPEQRTNPSPWFAAYREHAARAGRLIDDALARAPVPRRLGAAPPDSLHGLMSLLHVRLSALRSPVRLLQVGAHDGREADPYHALLRGHRWHGVLLEPVGHLFARLRQTYAGCPGVSLRQVAAGAADGRAVLYAVKALDQPPVSWFSMISSLEIAPFVHHASAIPDLAAAIDEVTVETRMLDTLIAEHDFAPDVVSVSAEGHEAKVLSGLDLPRWRPSLLRVHVQHLTEPDATAVALRLKRAGYVAARDPTHLVAFLPELLSAEELRAVAADSGGLAFL